jgi:hypothetical protein
MYGASGEKSPIFIASDAFLYTNLGYPTYSRVADVVIRLYFSFAIILDFSLDWMIHSLIISRPLAENIWQSGVTIGTFGMIHSMYNSLYV